MKNVFLHVFTCGLVVATTCVAAVPDGAQDLTSPASIHSCINVLDVGAAGDGVADDSDAIQRAVDMAGKRTADGRRASSIVFFPSGTYRLTKTIRINRESRVSALSGCGPSIGLSKWASSQIKWAGDDDETMFRIDGHLGLEMTNLCLDGNKKAGVILRINSVRGVGTALLHFRRVDLFRARIGMELGADMDSCASDMTFVDVNIKNMTECGFRTKSFQNVDYVFIRCIFSHMPVGVHFERGGVGHFILPAFGWVNTAFKIDNGGIGCGVFSVTGLQLEQFSHDNPKKRFTLLETTRGEINVSFTSIYTSATNVWGPDADLETPNFILGSGSQVSVRDSMISGKVARLAGSFLSIENSRFRCASDPRKDIDFDENSGFELRNCRVTLDDTKAEDYNKRQKTIFIDSMVRLPPSAAFKDYEWPQ